MQGVKKNRGIEMARNQKSAECCGRGSNLKEVASKPRMFSVPEDFVCPFLRKRLTVWFENLFLLKI